MGRTTTKRKNVKNGIDEEKTDDEIAISQENDASRSTTKRTKRTSTYEEEDTDQDYDEDGASGGDNIGNEMSHLINKFGSDMQKNISAKKKRLESLTAQSASNCREKVDAILDVQRKDRLTLSNEYEKHMNCLFGQWEADIVKVKENEENLNTVLQQKLKLISQIRIVQTQRLKSLRQLQEQYLRSNKELESDHGKQKNNVCNELKEELSSLQTKILKDTQAQEMASMKKSLHSMLFH